ncbi:hypothetical protein WN943_019173 [Citrus x changshan-huyou]
MSDVYVYRLYLWLLVISLFGMRRPFGVKVTPDPIDAIVLMETISPKDVYPPILEFDIPSEDVNSFSNQRKRMIKHIAADILKDPNFVSEFVQNLSPPSLVVSSSTPTAVQFSTPFVDALVPAPFNPVPDLPPSCPVESVEEVEDHSWVVCFKRLGSQFPFLPSQILVSGTMLMLKVRKRHSPKVSGCARAKRRTSQVRKRHSPKVSGCARAKRRTSQCSRGIYADASDGRLSEELKKAMESKDNATAQNEKQKSMKHFKILL